MQPHLLYEGVAVLASRHDVKQVLETAARDRPRLDHKALAGQQDYRLQVA